MRVAVLLHGRYANYLDEYASLLRAIGYQHEVDVFYSKNSEEAQNDDDFINFVKPVAHVIAPIEYDEKLKEYPKRYESNYHNTLCMMRNRQRVWELFEQNKTKDYDICISSRADLLFRSDFDLDEFMKNRDFLYIPLADDYGGLSDHIAVGHPNIIKTYLNIYKNLINLLRGGTIFHPETLLRSHVINTGTPVSRFHLSWGLSRRLDNTPVYIRKGSSLWS